MVLIVDDLQGMKTRSVQDYVKFLKDRKLVDCMRPGLLKILNLGGGDFNSKDERNTQQKTHYQLQIDSSDIFCMRFCDIVELDSCTSNRKILGE